jgi:hypothetical protein
VCTASNHARAEQGPPEFHPFHLLSTLFHLNSPIHHQINRPVGATSDVGENHYFPFLVAEYAKTNTIPP